jgi:hypothetical protein
MSKDPLGFFLCFFFLFFFQKFNVAQVVIIHKKIKENLATKKLKNERESMHFLCFYPPGN